MSTLVYAPGVKVYIDTKSGPLDVTDDLINGQMDRRSDGVSTFSFSLNNARRKYDRIFSPNDRIIVMMKRITWVQVFTGYLDTVPLLSSWPRVVSISASCSLKRLRYFFWDPTLSASQVLVRTSLVNDPTGRSAPDGGIANALRAVLEKVVDWSGSVQANKPELAGTRIHIGGIPKDWFNLAAGVAQELQATAQQEEAVARQLLMDAGALASVAGTSVDSATATGVGNGSVPYGTYDAFKMTQQQQASNATTIIRTVITLGGSRLQAEQALACAMQESTLTIVDHGDSAGPDSRGLYQQRANGAWGSYSDRMDPVISTTNFFKVLKTHPGGEFWEPIYKTQRCASSVKRAYARWQKAAEAMTATYFTKVTTATGNDPNSLPPGLGTGKTTGSNLVAFATQLVKSRQIPYGHSTSGLEDYPPVLDCSSFVRHAYWKVTGDKTSIPRTSQEQMAWAIKGVQKISVEQALNTPGAVLGVTNNGQASGCAHIEIAVGDGKSSVGAHRSGFPASVHAVTGYGFNIAALLPGVAYPGAGADAKPSAPTNAGRPSPENGSRADPADRGANATGGSTAGSSGRRITDAERQRLFGSPGDTSNRTDYKTPWGFTIRGIHRSIAGRFQQACEEAKRTSRWTPVQGQCLPPLDSSGLPRRPVRGRSDWSLHSYGLAVDWFNTSAPSDVWGQVNAPDEAFRNAFKKYGFYAGADYQGRKDYPHIEWAAAPPDGSLDPTASDFTATTDATTTGIDRFLTTASAANTDVTNGTDVVSSLFGSSPWVQLPGPATGQGFTGRHALANDVPILPYIDNLCKSTLRSYCSAPNGDFIAWFPDYYGLWGTAAKMVLQPIEVKDFTVTWSDEHLVTHQFVYGAVDGTNQFDITSGELNALNFLNQIDSRGVATVEQPGIMSLIFGQTISDEEQQEFIREVFSRFGPRVAATSQAGITGPNGEFFMAIYLFMQGWAYQFNANIDITFMPELYPGMLVQFPAYNFQAYVVGVQHAFDFNSGFRTTINIGAPARMSGASEDLFGLPLVQPGATGDRLGSPVKALPKTSSGGKPKTSTVKKK